MRPGQDCRAEQLRQKRAPSAANRASAGRRRIIQPKEWRLASVRFLGGWHDGHSCSRAGACGDLRGRNCVDSAGRRKVTSGRWDTTSEQISIIVDCAVAGVPVEKAAELLGVKPRFTGGLPHATRAASRDRRHQESSPPSQGQVPARQASRHTLAARRQDVAAQHVSATRHQP
jgi:hypothetical protein